MKGLPRMRNQTSGSVWKKWAGNTSGRRRRAEMSINIIKYDLYFTVYYLLFFIPYYRKLSSKLLQTKFL